MAYVLDRNFDFLTNGTVTAAGLHNLIDETDIYAGLISTQDEKTTVGTSDLLLVADSSSIGSPQIAPNRTTVYNLFEDALTGGTYANAQLSGNLTYGTATGNRTISTGANITNGTISTLIAGTTTSTAATITSGTIATLNSTTGTIANLSTTLAGDFTISSGTGTLGTSGATAGTYGSVTAIPFITVDAKGRITSATTGTFSTTPADGSITPAKLSQPFTSGTAVTATSGTAFDFTGIPSWVKRITVTFNSLSLDGTDHFLVQIGSGSITSSGYSSVFSFLVSDTNAGSTSSTSGFGIWGSFAPQVTSGAMQIFLHNSSSFIYTSSHCAIDTGGANTKTGAGSVTLTGIADRLRVTRTGTDSFDGSGGSINIMYEG